jgi:EAL domain-containing protein (putative c-di-GMP-specific phosphodiesterase class I)
MVESRASANYLRDIGVTYAQGDHIGRELDEDGLREWLVTHPDRAGP